MRRKDESKKPIIADFINAFYYEHDKVPSVREIVEGMRISSGQKWSSGSVLRVTRS